MPLNYYFFAEAGSIFIMEEDEFYEKQNQIEITCSYEIGEVIERSLNELVLYLLERKWPDKEIESIVDDELIKELDLKI